MTTTARITINDLLHELRFVTSRSSGPGGQNVNKVNSRVTLRWDVANSGVLSTEQRTLITRKLARYITHHGVLILQSQNSRSQLQNKEAANQKLDLLLRKAFTLKKPRKSTRPTGASKAKRLEGKKSVSEKKQWRKKLYGYDSG